MSFLADKDIGRIQKQVKEHLDILAGKITCMLLELEKDELVDILNDKEKLLANVEESVSILHNYQSENQKDFESRKLKRAHFSLLTRTIKPRFLDMLTKLRFQDEHEKQFNTNTLNFIYPQCRIQQQTYFDEEDVMKVSDRGGGIVVIRYLDNTITEEELYQTFNAFGNILYCKIFNHNGNEGKGIGILHYETKEACSEAIQKVNGMMINDQKVSINWIENELKEDLDGETEDLSVGELHENKSKEESNHIRKDSSTQILSIPTEPITERNYHIGKDTSTQTLPIPAQRFGPYDMPLPPPVITNPKIIIGDKQIIGEQIFPIIRQHHPNTANKITGILLEKCEIIELFTILRNRELLDSKIDEANKMLMKYKKKKFLSNGVHQIKMENFYEKLTEHDLYNIFKDFGEVFSIQIIKEEKDEKNILFALIQFTTKESVESAIQKLKGHLSLTKYREENEEKEEKKDEEEIKNDDEENDEDDLIEKANFVPRALHVTPIRHQYPIYQHMSLRGMRWPRPGYHRSPFIGQPRVHVNPPQQTIPSYFIQQQSKMNTPGKEPITASLLAGSTPSEQKQMIGERLFPLVQEFQPTMAGKITGMLLEIDNSELLHMLENRDTLLAQKVEEAVQVLQAFQAKEAEQSAKESDGHS